MEESISSSRTTAFYGNSYYCNYHHHQQQQHPAPVAPAATTTSDFEDADSSWTAYFLQLASDEEEDAVPCRNRSENGSASTVSKPNKAKDNNKQAAKKVQKKGVKKTRIVDEEEDSLQDTASSPLVQLNINGDLQGAGVGITSHKNSRDRPPVQRRRSAGDMVNGNGRIETLSDRQTVAQHTRKTAPVQHAEEMCAMCMKACLFL